LAIATLSDLFPTFFSGSILYFSIASALIVFQGMADVSAATLCWMLPVFGKQKKGVVRIFRKPLVQLGRGHGPLRTEG